MKYELNVDSGNALCMVKGGKNSGSIIHVGDADVIGHVNTIVSKDTDKLIEEFFNKTKAHLNFAKIEELYHHLKTRTPPKNLNLLEIYSQGIDILDRSNGREVIIDDGKIVPVWDTNMDRQVFYVTGMSGSGKSTYTGELISIYRKLYPKRPVFVFSNKPSDPALDAHKINRPKLDAELYENQLDLEVLRQSLVIYDDVEAVKDKNVNSELDRIRDLILQQGRSYNVDFVYISHLANDYKRTRTILNECNSITIFPRMCTPYSLKYLLTKYFGFNKADMNKLMQLPSRWVTIFKCPFTVVYDTGVYLL